MWSTGERLDGIDSEAAALKLRGRAGTSVTVKVHSVSINSSPVQDKFSIIFHLPILTSIAGSTGSIYFPFRLVWSWICLDTFASKVWQYGFHIVLLYPYANKIFAVICALCHGILKWERTFSLLFPTSYWLVKILFWMYFKSKTIVNCIVIGSFEFLSRWKYRKIGTFGLIRTIILCGRAL